MSPLDMSVQSTADRLSRFLKNLGADLVLDLKVAEDWSILEMQREFLQRWRAREQEGPNLKTKSHTVLSSLCPGWVCYAEKTHGDWLLPHISRSDPGDDENYLQSHLTLLQGEECPAADGEPS